MLRILLFALAAAQAAATAPKPLPMNPPLPYPQQARIAGVEGDVVFRVQVDEGGKPTLVTLAEVPRKGVGIEEAFAAALLQWRFAPARQGGMPVAGTYEARVTLEMMVPEHTARMYKVTPDAAWAAVGKVAAAWKIKASTRDNGDGVLIGSIGQRQTGADSEELHVFVPMDARPARVYLGSWQERSGGRELNHRDLNNRFYEALERELRVSGEPVPQTPWRRAVRALQMLPDDAPGSECLRNLAAGGGRMPSGNRNSEPRVVKEIEVKYPGAGNATPVAERVGVRGVVGEDGFFLPLQVERGTAETTAEFAGASLGAASLWRFKPGMLNGCPVVAEATIVLQVRR